MRILVESITENPVSLLRRAGYAFQRKDGDEMSFVRPLAQAGYPRFHCYAELRNTALFVNLHLDHKKHTYGDATRHHGEYENDGPVKEEGTRLLGLLGEKARIL